MKSSFYADDKFKNPFFIGTVEDNNDPTFNYRVKVRIPTLHNDVMTTDQLPWAARVDSAFMGTSNEGDLKHAIPEIGSQVLLLAIANDPNSLIYLGVLYKKTPQTPIGENKFFENEKYTGTYGIYRKNGQFIGVDKIISYLQVLFDGTVNVDKVIDAYVNVKNTIDTKCTTNNLTNTDTNVKTSNKILTEAGTIQSLVKTDAMVTAGNSLTASLTSQEAYAGIDGGGNVQVKANDISIACQTASVTTLSVGTGATGVIIGVGTVATVKDGIIVSIA